MSNKSTLKEVALAAGVSAQTVSRVVNQRPDVGPETRARVQEAIDRLGYRPNILARSLITRQSRSLGVVVTGLEFFGPSNMLIGIDQEANLLGYTLNLALLHDPGADPSPLLSDLSDRQVDGIIWAVPPIGINRVLFSADSFAHLPPVIFLNAPDRASSVVAIDNFQGACLAVQHLLDSGYRRIGMVSGPPLWWESAERVRGWSHTLQSAGLAPDPALLVHGDWTAASGEAAFEQLVGQVPDLDAVFAANDQMAFGVLNAADKRGLPVPDRLGVIGFDDYPESQFFLPALSTVRQPLRELGAAAVRELITMIRTGAKGDYEHKTIILQPKLVIRKSTQKSHFSSGGTA